MRSEFGSRCPRVVVAYPPVQCGNDAGLGQSRTLRRYRCDREYRAGVRHGEVCMAGAGKCAEKTRHRSRNGSCRDRVTEIGRFIESHSSSTQNNQRKLGGCSMTTFFPRS